MEKIRHHQHCGAFPQPSAGQFRTQSAASAPQGLTPDNRSLIRHGRSPCGLDNDLVTAASRASTVLPMKLSRCAQGARRLLGLLPAGQVQTCLDAVVADRTPDMVLKILSDPFWHSHLFAHLVIMSRLPGSSSVKRDGPHGLCRSHPISNRRRPAESHQPMPFRFWWSNVTSSPCLLVPVFSNRRLRWVRTVLVDTP